jgi:hypothetical protein
MRGFEGLSKKKLCGERTDLAYLGNYGMKRFSFENGW